MKTKILLSILVYLITISVFSQKTSLNELSNIDSNSFLNEKANTISPDQASVFTQHKTLPNVELYSLDGKKVSASMITNNGQPMIVVFWKTNIKECYNQLDLINEVYEDYLEEKNVKVIAICVDCIGNAQHIKPFVYGHDLNIEVYIDRNGNFKRSMNIPSVPYAILYDQKMNVTYRQLGFCNGDESLLCKKIEDCLISTDSQITTLW